MIINEFITDRSAVMSVHDADYMSERSCFVADSVTTLAENCSREYGRQLRLVNNSARNVRPSRLICRSFSFPFSFHS